jgi:hypothetical protein
MAEIVLQSLIGTDKRNPYLHVCRRKDSSQLDIFYGAQHLETVVDNKDHISFRAAVGRLYNAGLNRRILSKVFGVDRKTLQRWGQALLMPDAEASVHALRSRSEPRKLTVEIRKFAEVRFEHIYSHNRYSYNSQIRKEIFETFSVQLSPESLRAIFSACKQRLSREKSDSGKTDSSGESDTDEPNAAQQGENDRSSENIATTINATLNASTTNNPYQCPSNSEDRSKIVHYVHHAGVLIFAWYLSQLQTLHTHGTLLKQWLALILLEVVNIEQSKYVNWKSLEMFLGQTVSGTLEQRRTLQDIASSTLSEKVLAINAQVAGVGDDTDFYYDPHTKHYTGMHKILKGWCANIRWADKALHNDYIHTRDGMPVFVEYADNYHDLRERFSGVIEKFRLTTAIDPQKKITIAIDRGIYSIDIFQSVKQNPTLELVSWEKGFMAGAFDQSKCDGHFEFARTRNHSNDLRLYKFEYIDELWNRDQTIRRIVVRATNPQGRTIQVSILCTDLTRNARELILLMFRRWLQENDFKYLDKHYGINQITSYAVVKYEELQETVVDKMEENGQRKALLANKRELQDLLKRLLHKEHTRKNRIVRLKKAIAELTETMSDVTQKKVGKKKLGQLKGQLTRNIKKDSTEEKEHYDQQIESLDRQLAQCAEKVSKFDRLVQQGYERLDVQKKKVMDSIKILARNLFYSTLTPFKNAYNNYRDDHDYFRRLTHAPGLWVETEQSITIYLEPAAHIPPKLDRCYRDFLDQLQNTPLILPDGSGRICTLKLRPNEGFKLAIA